MSGPQSRRQERENVVRAVASVLLAALLIAVIVLFGHVRSERRTIDVVYKRDGGGR